MSETARALLRMAAALLGAALGFAVGYGVWILGYYLVAMTPQGIPLRYIDQGALGGMLTGPLGAVACGLWAWKLAGKALTGGGG